MKDKIPSSLLSIIRNVGKAKPTTEFSEALSFEGSSAEALELNRYTNTGLRPTIIITYQFTQGGSGLRPALLATTDNDVVGLRPHKALTIHPGEQCLVALRLRIRIPGGVACYTTPLPPAKILAGENKQIDTIGEPMPIDESYYGEMFFTVPNFTKNIMTHERGDFIAAICSRVNPIAIDIQEDTFCKIPGKPPVTFGYFRQARRERSRRQKLQ